MTTITEQLIAAGHTTGDVCPKCWDEAYMRSLEDGRPQIDHYQGVIEDAESGRLTTDGEPR